MEHAPVQQLAEHLISREKGKWKKSASNDVSCIDKENSQQTNKSNSNSNSNIAIERRKSDEKKMSTCGNNANEGHETNSVASNRSQNNRMGKSNKKNLKTGLSSSEGSSQSFSGKWTNKNPQAHSQNKQNGYRKKRQNNNRQTSNGMHFRLDNVPKVQYPLSNVFYPTILDMDLEYELQKIYAATDESFRISAHQRVLAENSNHILGQVNCS